MKMDYRGTVERVFNELTFTLPSANRPLNGLTAELVNMCTDKVEVCADHGIEISEEEWSSHHLPKQLMTDRGEPQREEAMISYVIRKQTESICPNEKVLLEQGTHASLYKDEEIILDCLVIDPLTAEPQRPYLKLIIDRYSRTVIGRKYCK